MSSEEEVRKEKKSKKKSSKKSKHKKSKKKSSKKSKHRSSGSENESADEWVEKKVEDKEKKMQQPERDDWMTSSNNFLLPTFSKEQQKPKEKDDKNYEKYDPKSSTRELNPYWKTGEGGLPSFQKPKDNDDDDDHFSKPSKSSGNWRKSNQSEPRKRSRSKSPSPLLETIERSFKPQSNPESSTASHSDFLTDAQMNDIGAKMIKAEIMGNTTRYEELKDKLEKAKAFKKSGKAAPQSSSNEGVLLTLTNPSTGTSRPISQREDQKRNPQDRRNNKKKRAETHLDGERTKYYADDDKYDIKQMFEREKLLDGTDQDIEFAKAIAKVKDNDKMDMADIFSDTIRKDAKQKDERGEAIREHNRMEKVLDSCYKCFESPKMNKDLVVHVGEKIYLAIPYYEGLVPNHLIISPIQHTSCSTMLDEEVWDEITTLKKGLTQFFTTRNEDILFFEMANYLHKRPHMEIHCIASKDLELAQFYFKKAILECDDEFSMNKKLVDLKANKNDVRRSVPKGMSYFWIDFGENGMAHVIENQEKFSSYFAQEIIGGILNLNVNKWRKPRKEQQPTKRTNHFGTLLKTVFEKL
ncbi:unnamed protein product [Diamesa hyperborea]